MDDVVYGLCVVCNVLEVRFVLSLNDDGESNVREVIQNLELLLDLRETSCITFCVLIGMDVIEHGLSLHVHVLRFVS